MCLAHSTPFYVKLSKKFPMVYIRQLKKYKKYVPKGLIQSKKKSKKWTKHFRNNLTNTM